MDLKKRLEEILWERDNAPEKFKACAHEYFNEMVGVIEDHAALRQPAKPKMKKKSADVLAPRKKKRKR